MVRPRCVTAAARVTGLYHLANLNPGKVDLADALRRILAMRIPLDGASHHGVSEAPRPG